MNQRSVVLFLAGGMSIFSVASFAQNNRSFVATFGNDANNCTAGSECRSFTRALAVTNSGGEVVAVNSGGFGAFAVSTSVTVAAAPGVRASITTGVTGISIAALLTDRIVLSGLTIFQTGGVYDGIEATHFRTLSIENCTINGGQSGVLVAGSPGSYAVLSDVVVRNPIQYGIMLSSHVSLSRCRIEGGGANTGLYVTDGPETDGAVSAVDVTAVDNINGTQVYCSTTNHYVVLDLDRASMSGNASVGVLVTATDFGGAVVRVSNSMATENGAYGFQQLAGASIFHSLGNNFVAGNGLTDTQGTIGIITLH